MAKLAICYVCFTISVKINKNTLVPPFGWTEYGCRRVGEHILSVLKVSFKILMKNTSLFSVRLLGNAKRGTIIVVQRFIVSKSRVRAAREYQSVLLAALTLLLIYYILNIYNIHCQKRNYHSRYDRMVFATGVNFSPDALLASIIV